MCLLLDAVTHTDPETPFTSAWSRSDISHEAAVCSDQTASGIWEKQKKMIVFHTPGGRRQRRGLSRLVGALQGCAAEGADADGWRT